MVSRCKYSGSSEIGVYCLLTNKYALIPYSNNNFVTHFLEDPREIPIIQTSVSSTDIIGRISVGNKHGLLLPSTTAQYEIQNIHSQMPDGIVIATVDEPFSALGNVISANDKIALVNPDLDEETIQMYETVSEIEYKISHSIKNHYEAIKEIMNIDSWIFNFCAFYSNFPQKTNFIVDFLLESIDCTKQTSPFDFSSFFIYFDHDQLYDIVNQIVAFAIENRSNKHNNKGHKILITFQESHLIQTNLMENNIITVF